jgi:putative transposase
MAIPLRHADPANITAGLRTFFVTSSIAAKLNLLQSHRAAQLFIDVLYDYRAKRKYLLHGFVVMPDHIHLLITVTAEISIERAVQFIKAGFAFRAGKELGFIAPVWERGFSEVRICEPEAFARICEYIIQNPVRRGLVASPTDYPFSSSQVTFELDKLRRG